MHLDGADTALACTLSKFAMSVCDESYWAAKMRALCGYCVGAGAECDNRTLYRRIYGKSGKRAVREALKLDLGLVRHLDPNGDVCNKDPYSAIMSAAKGGVVDIMRHLVTTIRVYGDHTLDNARGTALECGHVAMAMYLGEYSTATITPWLVDSIVLNGHLESLQYLASIGVSLCRGQTQLKLAAKHGYLSIVAFLLDHGAKIDAWNGIAIRYAVKNGHLDIVKLLVERGANVHASNDMALKWAKQAKRHDIVSYLSQQ